MFAFILFISIFQLVIVAMHLLVAKIIVSLFGLSGGAAQTVYISALVLGVFFTLASVLTRYIDNTFSEIFYTAAATWAGVFLYVFLIAVLLAVVSAFVAIPISFVWVGFVLAAVFSLYGIINANTIITTYYTVSLKNMPVEWIGKRLVFVADTHLGQVRGLAFINKVVAKINDLKPDIVFHGGDYYDGVLSATTSQAKAFSAIKAQFGTYIVTGNHDSYGDEKGYVKAFNEAGMTVVDDNAVLVHGVIVAGAGYDQTQSRTLFHAEIEPLLTKIDLLRTQNSLLKDSPVLYLKHVPDNVDISRKIGNGLQFSGHTHHGQVWPFRYITSSMYKGFDYGLNNVGQDGQKVTKDTDFKVLTTSGVGTWGPPLRTFTKSEIVVVDFK